MIDDVTTWRSVLAKKWLLLMMMGLVNWKAGATSSLIFGALKSLWKVRWKFIAQSGSHKVRKIGNPWITNRIRHCLELCTPDWGNFPFVKLYGKENTSHNQRPPTSATIISTTQHGVWCAINYAIRSVRHTWLFVDSGAASKAGGRAVKWVTNAKIHVPTIASHGRHPSPTNNSGLGVGKL